MHATYARTKNSRATKHNTASARQLDDAALVLDLGVAARTERVLSREPNSRPRARRAVGAGHGATITEVAWLGRLHSA